MEGDNANNNTNNANNNANSNPNAQNTAGQSNNANQPNNNSNAIDYNKIQEMIDGRNAKTEDSVLKSYFQKQGLSEDEMNSAIESFKTNKAQKEQEVNQNNLNLQNENASLKAQMLKMQVNEVANGCALEMGVDAKTIPYLIKMADLKAAVDDKGQVLKEAVTTALTKVLEDLPQLKSPNTQNKGFTKIGAENNNAQPNMDDVLKNIFSN